MSDNELQSPRPDGPHMQVRHSALVAVLVASLLLGGVIAFAQSGTDKSIASTSTEPAAADDTTPASVTDPADSAAGAVTDPAAAGTTPTAVGSTPVVDTATADGAQDLDGSDLTAADGCVITVQSVRAGATGSSVTCLQNALTSAGYYSGSANGTFDQATDVAVHKMQEDRGLFVDGVVGRESAISLGIWPEEASLVVHTPPPPPGAVDSLGYPLSTVSSVGANAPPLPENSGSGKRVVYDRAGQRVWAVSADNVVIRSWLVSGSKYSNETPGVHKVYSKSEVSTAWNGKAYLPKMVRYLQTDIGHIGFHGIPTHVNDGSAYQTEAELGTRLSGGCQRQANRDAAFLWDFADIGTTVVVI